MKQVGLEIFWITYKDHKTFEGLQGGCENILGYYSSNMHVDTMVRVQDIYSCFYLVGEHNGRGYDIFSCIGVDTTRFCAFEVGTLPNIKTNKTECVHTN